MPKTKKLIINLFLILIVLAFFLTSLGYESKIIINRIFASAPEIAAPGERQSIQNYNWKLKDENWDFFNFKQSEDKVIFVSFWASWHIPAVSELSDIQKLYDDYNEKIDFYVITDEEKAPVEEFMEKRGYTFPVTYLIIGEEMPFDAENIPAGYILDKQGRIAAQHSGVTRWNSTKIRTLLNDLILNK